MHRKSIGEKHIHDSKFSLLHEALSLVKKGEKPDKHDFGEVDSADKSGQFRTPTRIILVMVQLVEYRFHSLALS
jgi:hypothetical protein